MSKKISWDNDFNACIKLKHSFEEMACVLLAKSDVSLELIRSIHPDPHGWWYAWAKKPSYSCPPLHDGLRRVITAQYEANPVQGIKLDLRIREALRAADLSPL